ncbi:hypothetical protein SAMN05192553_104174 [Cyclobacterium xiamenense]|uniref:NnrS protein n=2 Tax=Cyclobacterium xiamenense TaxID=1297121 RepID=A0A1H6Z2P1_9BACT|nr:hypothetical protein SAMN05192553_104174 [Cyclobacterium xiamenense]
MPGLNSVYMKKIPPAYLLPLVVGGLLAGLLGGWLRLGYGGFSAPLPAAHHGVLMVGGFLGTLISLERSVVMKNPAWLLLPLLSGLSIPLFLGGWQKMGAIFLLIASLGLLVLLYKQSLRTSDVPTYLIAFGGACWMLGNFTYLYTDFVVLSTGWWMAFLFFTILGERLELSRYLSVPIRMYRLLYLLLAAHCIGLLLPFHLWGRVVLGASALGVGIWLLRYDMARHGVKKPGQFRYIGFGLLVGYAWLVLHGLVLLFLDNHPFHYDLYLHTFFLGFVFSMIWSHAPIIFPAVFGIKVDVFHPLLWWVWGVFQLSLVARIASSWAGWPSWRFFFGALNGFSIIAVFLSMALVVGFRWRVIHLKSSGMQTGSQRSGLE